MKYDKYKQCYQSWHKNLSFVISTLFNMNVSDKIKNLREKMRTENIGAYIVYSADPHLSEYLPEYWQERTWLSGFMGSAGFVVITLEKAALWTDGRYFVQAPKELEGSGIELMKDGLAETPVYTDWILENIAEGQNIAANALVSSHAEWEKLDAAFKNSGHELISKDLIGDIWTDRPRLSENPVKIHPDKWAGKSTAEKLKDIREKMKEKSADVHIITALDDIAWTLNLRGSDVSYNPVFVSYLLLTQDSCSLFIQPQKISEEVHTYLTKNHIEIKAYDDFFNALKNIKNQKVWLGSNANQAIFQALEANAFITLPPPGNLMKAIKNPTELEGFRTVMKKDGVAMVKFLYWLTHEGKYQNLTEHQISEKLHAFRAEGEHFVGDSFTSIIGYAGNGAIVHYAPDPKHSAIIEPKGSILLDSGGQYLEGTTDITRIVALGEVSDEFKTDVTLVLKGMIQLSMAKFPKGTRGVQLDALARLPLWKAGKDYNHGTGHGVGSYMNVHEGPQNFRKDLNPQTLEIGMVLSNEPGYYVENQYGIRHENLVAVKESANGFLELETLTICPFFTDILVKELMTEEEISWLNAYHHWVKEQLEPHLEGEIKTWFLELVAKI